jgi:uncharacterized protein (DUF1697 family)
MKTYIALLRGINVTGNHMLPMKDLRSALEKHGCVDVQTYLQSGNAIFRSTTSDPKGVAKRLSAAISKSHGFEPRVLILTRRELEKAAADNPFPEAGENPKSLHLFFLAETPKKADLKSFEAVRAPTERFALTRKIFYLHTPDGFGISKLASRTERLLGVAATARNWRTVTALIAMAKEMP